MDIEHVKLDVEQGPTTAKTCRWDLIVQEYLRWRCGPLGDISTGIHLTFRKSRVNSMSDNREHLIDFDDYVKGLCAPGTFHDAVDTDPDCPIKKADVLLLTCMDFRFFEEIARLMKDVKYDH